MSSTSTYPTILGIIRILIDVLNIGEQFGIYFIIKQDDANEEQQQRLFFIILGIGALISLEGFCCHPIAKTIFHMVIEIGEYICYMFVFPRTYTLVLVASIFFGVQMILYILSIILTAKKPSEGKLMMGIDIILTPVRFIVYCILIEIHFLCLFLNKTSSFRGDLYEILFIANASFTLVTAPKLISLPVKLYKHKHGSSKDSKSYNDDAIYLVWQMIIFVLSIITTAAMMIIGLIYTSLELRNKVDWKTYETIAHVILTAWYSLILLLLFILILASIPICLCGACAMSALKLKDIFK